MKKIVQKIQQRRGEVEAEAAKAVKVRKAALETFSQSKKRKREQVVKKSKRATGSETVAYLKEKSELNADLKKEELQLRQRKLDEKQSSTRQLFSSAGKLYKDANPKYGQSTETAGTTDATDAVAEFCAYLFIAGYVKGQISFEIVHCYCFKDCLKTICVQKYTNLTAFHFKLCKTCSKCTLLKRWDTSQFKTYTGSCKFIVGKWFSKAKVRFCMNLKKTYT